MLQTYYKNGKPFSTRKVSTEQAIRALKRNGITVDEEMADIILEFLYLIARTYRIMKDSDEYPEIEPKSEIEHHNLHPDEF